MRHDDAGSSARRRGRPPRRPGCGSGGVAVPVSTGVGGIMPAPSAEGGAGPSAPAPPAASAAMARRKRRLSTFAPTSRKRLPWGRSPGRTANNKASVEGTCADTRASGTVGFLGEVAVPSPFASPLYTPRVAAAQGWRGVASHHDTEECNFVLCGGNNTSCCSGGAIYGRKSTAPTSRCGRGYCGRTRPRGQASSAGGRATIATACSRRPGCGVWPQGLRLPKRE